MIKFEVPLQLSRYILFHLCSFLLLTVTIILCSPAWTVGDSRGEAGVWSQETTLLSHTVGTLDIPGKRKVDVLAPDHRKIANVNDFYLQVVVNGRPLSGTENEGLETLAELAWAPDSTAFFITASNGGIVGTWYVSVYLIEKTRVRRVNVTQRAAKRFKMQYSCHDPEEPNMAGVKWLEGSKTLLVVAEVPPHSSCPEMEKVRGYIVSVPNGEIEHELTREELKANWSQYLGPRINHE